jgi:hypothetical protein
MSKAIMLLATTGTTSPQAMTHHHIHHHTDMRSLPVFTPLVQRVGNKAVLDEDYPTSTRPTILHDQCRPLKLTAPQMVATEVVGTTTERLA